MEHFGNILDAAFPWMSSPLTMHSDEHSNLPECAICLETSDHGIKMMLSCGHVFCQSCLSQYVGRESLEQRQICCPLCRKSLLNREVAACHEFLKCDAPELLASIQGRSSSSSSSSHDEGIPGSPEDLLCEVCLEEVAHMEDMKRCPSCNALIQKDGGCDHMRCRCGHRFNWSEVPVLATSLPCNCVHHNPALWGPFGLWGTTCPNSTLTAKAKLMARRTGLVAVAVPGTLVVGGLVVVGGAVGGLLFAAGKGVANVKSALESPVTKAQREVDMAERKLQREEQIGAAQSRLERFLWSNSNAIAEAKASLQQKRQVLQDLQSKSESPITKAQRELDEAELKAQREEQKWFNSSAIAEAKASVEEKRQVVQNLEANETARGTGLFNWLSAA